MIYQDKDFFWVYLLRLSRLLKLFILLKAYNLFLTILNHNKNLVQYWNDNA